jgi:hypothetical protein
MPQNDYLFVQRNGKYYTMNNNSDVMTGGGTNTTALWTQFTKDISEEFSKFLISVATKGIGLLLDQVGIDPNQLHDFTSNPQVKEELNLTAISIVELIQELAEHLEEPLHKLTEQIVLIIDDVGGQILNSVSTTGVNLAVDLLVPIPVIGLLASGANTINRTVTDALTTTDRLVVSYKMLVDTIIQLLNDVGDITKSHSSRIHSNISTLSSTFK